MYSIEVENLTKNFSTKIKAEGFKQSIQSMFHPEYQSIDAVKNISFKVTEGEIVAFIGPNGAGKSTTIKMMTGILHPTSGSIKVLGLDPVKSRRMLAKQIGTVFGQKSQLWFHLPPTDSFRLLGDIYEVPENEYKKRIDYLIDIFDISELLKTPVRKMSLGQRVRCEIAASLIHQPKILFLDEPTIGLDVVVKQKIRELILHINKEYKTTIFLTSHDAGDIEKICKRAMVIDHGKVVLDESVKKLKYDYLRRKIVAAKFNEKFKPINMEGVEIIKSTDYAASLHVDTELVSINKVISAMSKGDSLADITITDPPMEEIILDIFKKTAVNNV